jgi:uncharacterized protein (TIGR02466 family)
MLWDLMPRDVSDYQSIVVDLARKATALRPDVMKTWERLAWHLLKTGKHEEAAAALADAISRFPTEPRLQLMLAEAYDRAKRLDLAHEILHRLPPTPIGDRETTLYRLELLMRTKAAKNAVQVAADTLALDPTNMWALRLLGKVSRKKGNPEIMIPFCEAALRDDPANSQARYELAFTFAILERFEEAQKLINLDQFITVSDLAIPQSYADAATFNETLASEIISNPTLRPDPPHLATRRGLQTMDHLPHAGERAISDLINQIRLAIDAFEGNLSEQLDDPFITRRPRRAWINAWAVVYPGDGRQVAHIHPTSWLTGVYYVSAPKPSCEDLRSGCLVLGALEMDGQNVEPPWGIRDISPAPGRLVLLPSYVPHATIPTGSTEKRICVAFNVERNAA